jgi:hypothetical protein
MRYAFLRQRAEGRRQKAEGRSISYGDAYANRLLYLVTEGTAVSYPRLL